MELESEMWLKTSQTDDSDRSVSDYLAHHEILCLFGFKSSICLGYKGDSLKHFFELRGLHSFTISYGHNCSIEYHNNHDESDWKITLVDTGLLAMTGARVKRIRDYIGDHDFMLTMAMVSAI